MSGNQLPPEKCIYCKMEAPVLPSFYCEKCFKKIAAVNGSSDPVPVQETGRPTYANVAATGAATGGRNGQPPNSNPSPTTNPTTNKNLLNKEAAQRIPSNNSGTEYHHHHNSVTPGIHNSDEHAVAVTFNVIIPVEFWMWDKSDCSVCLRFGDRCLGDWEHDVGAFEIIREYDDDILMQCKLYIDVDVVHFGRPIAYKYLVYSPRREGHHPYEYICDPPHGKEAVNRCLTVPGERCHPKGSHNRYDGMIFPQVPPKSRWKRVGAAIKSLIFGSNTDSKSLTCPSRETIVQNSLIIHLRYYREFFFESGVAHIYNYTITQAMNSICEVYHQLRCCQLCNDNERRNDPWIVNIFKEFTAWFTDTIFVLHKLDAREGFANGKRMASVITIMCILYDMSINKNMNANLDSLVKPNVVSAMLSMLLLRPEIKSGNYKCEDLEMLLSFIPKFVQLKVTRALVEFAMYYFRMGNIDTNSPQWLYLLPLLHLLKCTRIPPLVKPLKLAEIKWEWDENFLSSWTVKERLKRLNPGVFSMTEVYIRDLEPLTKLDPLLLPQLVFICPSHELPTFFNHIPTDVSAAWLFREVNMKEKHGYFNVKEITKYSELVQNLNQVIMQQSVVEHSRIEATYNIIWMLIFNLKFVSKLHDKTPVYVKALHSVLELLFSAFAAKENMSPKDDSKLVKLMNEVQKVLRDEWIIRHYTPTFGQPNLREKKFSYAKEDLKAIDELARICCPEKIQSKWHEIIGEILKDRVARVNDDLKVELIVILESSVNPHPIISEVFIEVILQTFERKDRGQENRLEKLFKETQKHKAMIGKIVNKMISRVYRNDKTSVSIDDLLEWDMWPICIFIYRSEPMNMKGEESCLPDNCRTLCSSAVETLTDMMTRIFSGAITVEEIKGIKREQQIKKLCSAVMSEKEIFQPDKAQVKLELRRKEYEDFRMHRNVLATFCLELESVNIEGLSTLINEIKDPNHNQRPLNSLCFIKSEEPHNFEFLCFEAAIPLEPIIYKYRSITVEYHNVFFSKLWSMRLREVMVQKKSLSISDLVNEIWNPVFQECCTLVDSIEQKCIKLKDIDKYFYGLSEQDCYKELKNLFCALEKIHNRNPSPEKCKWIRRAVTHIEQYRSLCQLAEAANIILELKEKLNLSGNFGAIEVVSNKVSTAMKEETLESISVELIETKSFLEQVKNSKKKLNCLQKFAECSTLVEWIREEVDDLHKFVSVALHTSAGEGDLSSDKLSNLKTVGSCYGPLIFYPREDATLASFQERCKEVWKAMEDVPNLSKLLVDCTKELEWYKAVKGTQASVELTTYGQMNNIFNYGCYTIGSDRTKICQNYHEVIHLSLEEKDKPLTKKSYKLDELRDLESKLVLITGSKAENREQVNIFLDTFHSICRIAEVLITLQQEGNVDYMKWNLEVPCSTDRKVISELQDKAKSMELELERWRDEVKENRCRFYELNYYTTLQLLTLRRELGKLKECKEEPTISADVLALLQSISTEITSTEVVDALKRGMASIPKPFEQIPETHEVLNSSTTREDEAMKIQTSDSGSRADEIEEDSQELIDENHSVVTDLVSAGYSLEESIHAVEKYGTLDESLEYLETIEDEGEETQLLPSTAFHQEVPQEDPHGDRISSDRQIDQITEEPELEIEYLTIEVLGQVLKFLNESEVVQDKVHPKRSFSARVWKTGLPNLVIKKPEHILKTVLSLYMEDPHLPLPTPEEVLVCNPSTTAEEVELFWRRAINDPEYRRIFCLVHAEKLSYQVSDLALQSLSEHSQGRRDYRLVIICSNEEEEKSHFISKLHLFKRTHLLHSGMSRTCKEYLTAHFTKQVQVDGSQASECDDDTSASSVDHQKSCVRIVKSTRSGMGKSLYVQRLAEKLQQKQEDLDEDLDESASVHVTIPLHGPVVTPDTILELFKHHMRNPTCCIYHIDIAPNILWKVDTILFSLLILRGLSDSHGRVWRCHPNQLYTIEVTLPNREGLSDKEIIPESRTLSLLELLPSVLCLNPLDVIKHSQARVKDDSVVLMDEEEFQSDAYQRVCQYLQLYKAGGNLDSFSFDDEEMHTSKSVFSTQDCIRIIIDYCGVRDPSWSEIRNFVNFLNLQLESCEKSDFTNPYLTRDIMSGFKGFVVKFMIYMSRDFSTSSLCGEISLENQTEEVMDGDEIDVYQISERKLWEQNAHPYLFFNQDGQSMTFVGFSVTKRGDLIDPANNHILQRGIMTRDLYRGLEAQKVRFSDDYRRWRKSEIIQKLSTVMGVDYPYDPDESYVLTVDNLIKMLAIHMRFRCGIPVVIMGETGCGKTRLIRYMCDLARQGKDRKNMLILKVHGGTTEDDIVRFIEAAERESEKNSDMYTVAFFDEANTTDAIGLIKEVMCDHRIKGRPISPDIKFIAACNPYRKHTDDMIKRLENAGLGFFVKATQSQEKLGTIPLRQLVYRVLDLPASMRPLVYDFGQLNTSTESDYIRRIVHDHINKHQKLSGSLSRIAGPITNVLACSQTYMRQRKDECSFVSLRDVERTMIVFEYMYDNMDVFGHHMDQWATGKRRHIGNEDDSMEDFDYQSPGPITRALVLALSVCYHARLQERENYEEEVTEHFIGPISLPGGAQQFRDEIRWCQEVLLESMELGANIAKNAALRENVFMMAICIELKIPLFLVGKPGSSKSLAKSIINESMKGKHSRNDLLKGFKEVEIFSYQCSQLSTPESVIEVFNDAKRFQANQNMLSHVAVVVLDEVGLAEDSPNLPLKALHPLLEDGTEGAGSKNFEDEVVAQQDRVAFVGISNWALDPAKMNRGVMVTRADPSEEELVFSAKGICSDKKEDPVRRDLEKYFKYLAKAYKCICEQQKREFFGLRDFYSLIKMLYYMREKSNKHPLNWQQLEHAIKRNFGGLESEELNPFKVFHEHITMSREPPNLANISEELHPIINPDCSRLGLIKASLGSREKDCHGENRYMLFLTENYAALDILKNPRNYLSGSINFAQAKEGSIDSGSTDSIPAPFILFGSSFPKDKEYTQVCRNINQIKICMETGLTVILLNLENLYESLYDVLNQYYIFHGDSRYVDLGLQTHRVRCRVHNDFKLILIAEKDTVYDKFPTPLINRLEKHFILTSSILEDWQKEVLEDFEAWINCFSNPEDTSFKASDAFIGFQKDIPASVIFQATNQLKSDAVHGRFEEKITKCSGLNPEDLFISDAIKVLKRSQYLLLQTAAPDAIVRLKSTKLASEQTEIQKIYFQEQHHESMEDFLIHHVHENGTHSGLLMQVTTHSHLLFLDELKEVERAIGIKVDSFFLHEFDTELDFSNKIGPLFKTHTDRIQNRLVIIQCDSGHLNGDLIACARYRIYTLRNDADKDQVTHVLFVIHLPHQVTGSFIGFQGDPWISAHIDDLRPAADDLVAPYRALSMSISELFRGSCDTSFAGLTGDEQNYSSELESGEVSDHENDGFKRDSSSSDENESTSEGMESEEEEDEMDDGETSKISDEVRESPHEMGSTDMYVEDIESDDLSEKSVSDHSHGDVNSLTSVEPTQLVVHEGDDGTSAQIPVTVAARPEKLEASPLFKRLHGCIQAAASKFEDVATQRSIERVGILVSLIPEEIPNQPDFTTFHGVLIQHMCRILDQREQVWKDESEWVTKEAMNAKKLQHGGTFRNVLTRKVDEVVVPLFAEIIARIDRNYNLNLIYPMSQNSPLFLFWMNVFGNVAVMDFDYNEMITPRPQVPGVGGRKADVDFKCELPFSWLILDAVKGQWDNAKSSTVDNDTSQLHQQLCDSIEQTPFGSILNQIDPTFHEEFYRKYLHDYLRIEYRCHHKLKEHEVKEYELLFNALDALVHGEGFCSSDGATSLLARIAAVHVVYNVNRNQVLCFGRLVMHHPGIITDLKKKHTPDQSEMILHLQAVTEAFEEGRLFPKCDKDMSTANLVPWLRDVQLSQNAVTAIVNLSSQHQIRVEARSKWEVIQSLQLFFEHVMLNTPNLPITQLIKLRLLLKSEQSFSNVKVLQKVQKFLNKLSTEVTKKKLVDDIRTFQKHCHNYFVEVVSTLCFGGDKVPDPALIQMLMAIVYFENENSTLDTRDLTPFDKGNVDEVPIIRSSLLQLLLEHNFEMIKEHLEEFFHISQRALDKSNNQNLCLLCIQCFEDALYKEHSKLEDKVHALVNKLTDSFGALKAYKVKPEITIKYLEAIAGMRFALMEISRLLHLSCSDKQVSDGSPPTQQMSHSILSILQNVCTDLDINNFSADDTDIVGPAVYLLKLLVRVYGFPCLKQVCEAYPWIVPEGLRITDQEKVIDPFVIYRGYCSLRATVNEGAFGKQVEKMIEVTEGFDINEAVVLLLAFYETITFKYAEQERPISGDVSEKLNQFSLDMKSFSPSMRDIARLLLSNEQGGPLAQMTLRPGLPLECKLLGTLVIHEVSVFSSKANLSLLLPFINMMTKPEALMNAFLPTMPEDSFQEIRRTMIDGEKAYACPNGHRYIVGECGRPYEVRICNECGARIGGTFHRLLEDNTDQIVHDTTQTGHTLGRAELRTSIPAPERNLSSPAVCIMRALMHAAFIWCSCHQQDLVHDLATLVKPFVDLGHLPEYFWMHLHKDIQHLSRVTGRSMDESVLIIHLILKDILTREAPPIAAYSLASKEDRKLWEREFNTYYIQPVLEDLDDKIEGAMDLITNDDTQEHDQLFYLVYERVKVSEGNMEPHLWSYRQRVSLEHLGQTLQEKKLKDQYPILHEFLEAEPMLRATKYLPDVIKLQQFLYDTYHHRLDRADAKAQTIGDFLEKLKNENSRIEYGERIRSLQKAWELVGQNLKTHGALPVEYKHCLPAITHDVPLEYLIPTRSGAGACTASLVDFLTRTHNDFIHKCQTIATATTSQSEWSMHEVPITHIHHCHLLDYEHQIVSVVLSHCRYSLKVGEAHNVQYDYRALERHILNKFIHGKPKILYDSSDIPQVEYSKEIYTRKTFGAVRKNVHPQMDLDSHIRREILAELSTPDRLRESLDVIDIVIGFLSSAGTVEADKDLGDYIDKILRMKKKPFSKKAREYCKLKHIISLWKTLSLELSRLSWIHGQEPFDSMKDEYLKGLDKEVDGQRAALDKCLRTFDLDKWLGALYEFIETYVRYSLDNELTDPLKEIMETFSYFDLPAGCFEEFPESITLSQTVAVWKHTVLYHGRLRLQ